MSGEEGKEKENEGEKKGEERRTEEDVGLCTYSVKSSQKSDNRRQVLICLLIH